MWPPRFDRLAEAEAPIKIARMTLTIKLDRNLGSFQLANSAPPLSVTDSAITPSARMPCSTESASATYLTVFPCIFVPNLSQRESEAANTKHIAMIDHQRFVFVGARKPLNNSGSHIDASYSRQHLVKRERLVRYEVNAVMSSS